MLINNPGTANFWFDFDENPFAFIEGNNVKWLDFSLNGEHSIITSEGQTLSVTMNPQTERELLVFQTNINSDRTKKHMITVTWETKQVRLYLDAELLQEIDTSVL